jgi:hypothetical protein
MILITLPDFDHLGERAFNPVELKRSSAFSFNVVGSWKK